MIVLVGFMGAGKTTVGRLVAERVGLPFVDTDELVEARVGMTIAEVFAEEGEPAFRELEREAVLETLHGPETVVALGGGALGDPAVADALRRSDVVYLEASYETALSRVGGDAARPMLQRGDSRTLFDQRRATYESSAGVTIATDGRSPDEIAMAVAIAVRGGAPAAEELKRVVVPLERRSYEIVVGRDLLRRLDSLLPALPGAQKAFVFSHPGLDRFVKEAEEGLALRGLAVERVSVAEGESSKSVDVVARLWSELATRGAHKRDLVVGIGGGVVCDVGGFVAATYGRGLPLVHIPTTLLAQVDAAIGGKCGVNIKEGKNLIGAIYQPKAVICDVDLLASLPQEELRSGMAEVIKYGLIADPHLLDGLGEVYTRLCDGDPRALIATVSRCAAIKASFVSADEHEHGKRAFLNYGHTFAHAIERSRRYGGIRHGEAVAVGMMAAAYVSNELGRLSDGGVTTHRDALLSVGLPVDMQLDLAELEAGWYHDKKYVEGVRFVLLNDIGRPESGVQVERRHLQAAIERLAA